MGSINSLWTWLGLAALGIAIPILIHFIRRIRHVEWGAMVILERVLRRRRKRVRMEDLIVLILRCAALALLALALLRPTLLGRAGAWFLGSRGVGMVLAIDASYSMGHGKGETRFDAARAAAQKVLSTLKPGDPVAIVLLGSRPRVVLETTGYDEAVAERLLSRMAPLPEGLNVDPCLDQLQILLSELETPVRECVIISDAQVESWGRLSDNSSKRLEAMLADTDEYRQDVYFVPVGRAADRNMAATHLSFAGGALRKNATARFVGEVMNHGRDARMRTVVALEVDGRTVSTRALHNILPGERRVLDFSVPLRSEGRKQLTLRVNDDPDLELDNQRYAVADVHRETRVLCVEPGTIDPNHPRSATYFLRKALALKGRGPAVGLVVDVIDASRLARTRLEVFDVIIIGDPPTIEPEAAAQVAEMVKDGAGLIMLLGGGTDIAGLQEVFGEQFGMLPVNLLEAVAFRRGREQAVEVVDRSHAVSRALATLPQDILAGVRVHGYIRAEAKPEARTILALANGDPLLIEQPYGAGGVLLFVSSPDRSWNDLAVNPANPVWLHTAVSALTGAGVSASEVGRRLRIPAVRSTGLRPVLTDPNGTTRVGNIENKDGGTTIDLGIAGVPGFYTLRSQDGADTRQLAVNVDPSESNVRVLGEDGLAAVLAETDVRIIAADADIKEVISIQRIGYEFWRVLLILSLIAFFAQAFLSDRFSRRIIVEAPAT